MVQAERTLLFAGGYPDGEFGDPFEMVRDLPEALRPRVMAENAVAVYGERLLAANR
jgi:hypothetical protein